MSHRTSDAHLLPSHTTHDYARGHYIWSRRRLVFVEDTFGNSFSLTGTMGLPCLGLVII